MKRIRVNKSTPCPICGATQWCLIAPDGSDCICPRTPSAKEVKGATGAFVKQVNINDHVVKMPADYPQEWPKRSSI